MTRLLTASTVAALVLAGVLRREDDDPVILGVDPASGPDQTAVFDARTAEIQHFAAIRRARKVARQAKGFVS